ncbi:MAG: SGNH/GDSL hydrolase family protein [Actinomycetota bacterium]
MTDAGRSPAHRVARVALVVVGVLVVAELGARLLGPYLPTPELYADASTAVKVEQLDALPADDDCDRVVLVGSSMTRDDLVPAAMRPSVDDGVVVYNAALDAASPTLTRGWLDDHVIARAEPDLVVLGLASFDLNDAASLPEAALDSYREAPLTRSDLLGTLQEPFITHSALVRHRSALRDPVELWGGIGDLLAGDRAERPGPEGLDGLLDADGAGLSRRDLSYVPSASGTALVEQELLNDFSIDGAQVAALQSLIEDLRSDGIDVALVALPVTTDYVAAHPDGAADQDAFLDALRSVAEATDVPMVDLHDAVEDPGFADTHHLAGEAADDLSRRLPDLLAEAGVARPGCSGA